MHIIYYKDYNFWQFYKMNRSEIDAMVRVAMTRYNINQQFFEEVLNEVLIEMYERNSISRFNINYKRYKAQPTSIKTYLISLVNGYVLHYLTRENIDKNKRSKYWGSQVRSNHGYDMDEGRENETNFPDVKDQTQDIEGDLVAQNLEEKFKSTLKKRELGLYELLKEGISLKGLAIQIGITSRFVKASTRNFRNKAQRFFMKHGYNNIKRKGGLINVS